MPRGKQRTTVLADATGNVFYSRYREFRVVLDDTTSVVFSNSRAVVTNEEVLQKLLEHPNFGGTAPSFEDAGEGTPLFWRGGYPDWYIEKVRASEEGLAVTPEAHGDTDFVI